MRTVCSVRDLEQTNERPALSFEPQSGSPKSPTSWLSNVTLAAPGEGLPEYESVPLLPFLQLDLSDVPFRPKEMREVALLTLFIHPQRPPQENPNGTTWCLRTYRSLHGLQPLQATRDEVGTPLAPPALLTDSKDSPREGIKVGGWPGLLQIVIDEGPTWLKTGSFILGRGTDGKTKKDWIWRPF